MKDIKTFCKDHKRKLGFVGCVIGIAVAGVLMHKVANKEDVSEYAGQNVISWIPTDRFMDLERVKEVLDLNADNNESFAIFKEGLNKDDYACILISDNVITDK